MGLVNRFEALAAVGLKTTVNQLTANETQNKFMDIVFENILIMLPK